MRHSLVAVLPVAGSALLLAASGSPRTMREGGTFRVAEPGDSIGSIDAAVANTANATGPVCSSLMQRPDAPPPVGLRPEPELAAAFPKASADGKTYVFTIRKGLRFSTGASVTARDVAYTINRILNPALQSPLAGDFQAIVGAQDVLDGKATSASGVVARGNTLTITFTHRAGDFIATGASELCVLPASLPFDPEGVKAPVPTAAPYYIADYVPDQQLVLERNPYYKGSRLQHFDRFVFDLTVDENSAIDAVLNGKADYAWVTNLAYALRAPELARRFGVNKARFFVKPGLFLRMIALNTSRPLFRNNVPLRQAINYAIDRPALIRQLGGSYFGTPTDQFLVPAVPGFTNAHIYPVYKPDLAKARALARGHARTGKVVLYSASRSDIVQLAQIVRQDLKKIGLDVEIASFPPTLLFQKLATRGEPFDMAVVGFGFSPDPGFLTGLFDGKTIGQPTNLNWSNFDSPKYNRLLEQASRLSGDRRYAAYGKLDIELARNAAPAVAYGADNALTLVSARTGCILVNPYLDLGAVCLK